MQFLMKLALLTLASAMAHAGEPYCTRNETIIKRIPVTKTRLVIKKPTGIFKVFKKTRYTTEIYEDFEEQKEFKVVHVCCDGYKLNELQLCVPFCEQNCPEKAYCVEPNVCECSTGYVTAIDSSDGSHYCEPICEGSCPTNARCVEPDICECEPGYHRLQHEFECVPRCSSGCPFGGHCDRPEFCVCAEGYSAELGTCVPICAQGDGCQHGSCIAPGKCVCNKGFVWSELEQLCLEQNCDDVEECVSAEEFDMPAVVAEPTETTLEDNEENNRMLVNSTNTADTNRVSCPPNFFYYNNVCRPKHFASNEFDCRFKPCVEHAFCQANGTCACQEGYMWYKHASGVSLESVEGEENESSTEMTTTDLAVTTELTATSEKPNISAAVCLTPAQIQQLLATVRKSSADADDDAMDWLGIAVICMGALCMLSALCFLVVKLLRHRRQKIVVETTNDLMCSYDGKTYSRTPHVY